MIRFLIVATLLVLTGLRCVFGAPVADTLAYPVDEASYLNNYYNGRYFFAGSDHLGEDINLGEGTAIQAIGNGTVVVYRASEGYGELAVVIEHDLGTEYAFINAYGGIVVTRYILSISGHIRNKKNRTDTVPLAWKVGDAVSRGAIIGFINDDAHNGDGAEHLHQGIRLSNQATAESLDPLKWFRGYEKETSQGKHFSSAKDVIRTVQNGGIQQLCQKLPSGYILCWNPSSKTQVLCKEARAWTMYIQLTDIMRISTNQYCPSDETIPLYVATTADEVFGKVGGGGTGGGSSPPSSKPDIVPSLVHRTIDGYGLSAGRDVLSRGMTVRVRAILTAENNSAKNGMDDDAKTIETDMEVRYNGGTWTRICQESTRKENLEKGETHAEECLHIVSSDMSYTVVEFRIKTDANDDVDEPSDGEGDANKKESGMFVLSNEAPVQTLEAPPSLFPHIL